MIKRIRTFRLNIQNAAAILVIGTLTLIGVRYLVFSYAQTPSATVQAESGSLSSPAATANDSTANGGKMVHFSSVPSVRVNGAQLVDGQGKIIRLLGVNVSGTEGGCVNWGVMTKGAPLTQATADAIASWKINVVRVPLNEDCWLGINGISINGETSAASAQTYQAAIKQWASYLHNAGIIVILDLHWSAPASTLANAQYPMADEDHSPTFWQQVATVYKSDTAVIFGLFNEPYIGNLNVTTAANTPDWTCWLDGCTIVDNHNTPNITYTTAGIQQLVDTIRSTGANQPIMIGGLGWSGDPCGVGNKYGSNAACPEIANLPTDSRNSLIISYHSYYNSIICATDSCWTSHWNGEIGPINAAKIPMVTDEFGENDCSASFMSSYMAWADQNNESYLAWQWGLPNLNSNTCSTVNTGTDPNYWTNFALLSNYNGTPGTLNPQGPNYKAHLANVSPY
jgi:hypothetical protein